MNLTAIIFSSSLTGYSFFIISFALLGAAIKYIDDAFDENKFSKRNAIILSPLAALLWVFIMFLSPGAATLLLAILASVLIAKKIDNLAFILGFAIILLTLFFFVYTNYLWVPLAILTAAGIIDEAGNNLADQNRIKNPQLSTFFKYRAALKLATLLLALVAMLHWIFFLALIAFDSAYELVGKISATRPPSDL